MPDLEIKLTASIVREFLEYDPITGLFCWKHRDRKWFKSGGTCLYWNRRYAGTPAGHTGGGYLNIAIFKAEYRAHRLAWLYVYGEWPHDQIDHVNHVRKDNRIVNLRPASNQENQKNTALRKTNKSGIAGVFWHKSQKSWHAYITDSYKINRLGSFRDFFEACCARKSAERKYGFHVNHGKGICQT